MEANTPFAIVPIEVCLDDRLTKMEIKVLIALFSFRNKDTQLCHPSRKALSKRCGYTNTTISKITGSLVQKGWITKKGKGGFSKSTEYTITVPELETVSEPATVAEVDTGSGVQTGNFNGVRTGHTQRTDNRTDKKNNGAITLAQYLENRKAEGKPAIDENDPIFQYGEESDVPPKFLWLAWKEFCIQFDDPSKKQKDWVAHFRNAVRRDWLKIWAFSREGECYLTTRGKQAARIHLGEKFHD